MDYTQQYAALVSAFPWDDAAQTFRENNWVYCHEGGDRVPTAAQLRACADQLFADMLKLHDGGEDYLASGRFVVGIEDGRVFILCEATEPERFRAHRKQAYGAVFPEVP